MLITVSYCVVMNWTVNGCTDYSHTDDVDINLPNKKLVKVESQ